VAPGDGNKGHRPVPGDWKTPQEGGEQRMHFCAWEKSSSWYERKKVRDKDGLGGV
jgi:hypothetical protein